jgi:hypothetical protein
MVGIITNCFRTKVLWLGRQFWNQTFEDDLEADVEEICQILDEDEPFGDQDISR